MTGTIAASFGFTEAEIMAMDADRLRYWNGIAEAINEQLKSETGS